jgi:hypothetical protein
MPIADLRFSDGGSRFVSAGGGGTGGTVTFDGINGTASPSKSTGGGGASFGGGSVRPITFQGAPITVTGPVTDPNAPSVQSIYDQLVSGITGGGSGSGAGTTPATTGFMIPPTSAGTSSATSNPAIMIIAVVVLAALAYVGYRIYKKGHAT